MTTPAGPDLARRMSIVRRHHLGAPHHAATPTEVIASLGALHSSDPATVYLSIAARCPSATLADIDRVLYDGGHLRILGMRRTLFVVGDADVAAIHASSTRKIAEKENARLVKFLADNGIGGRDPADHLAGVKSAVVAVLAEADGEGLSGRELGRLVPELQQKIVVPGGEQGLTTMVLQRMPMDGTIVRGRPIGTWISSQYRYSLAPGDHGIDDPTLSVDEASRSLLAGYVRRFGPTTRDDRRWWTGWTATQVDRAGEGLEDGAPIAADAMEDVPAVAVLPALDPTVMGWRDRDWYLGPHATALFDRNGNAGPTLVVDGRIVGGWAQTADGEVVHRLLEEMDDDVVTLLDAECRRIERWLDGVVVTPRFRTPLERELSGR